MTQSSSTPQATAPKRLQRNVATFRELLKDALVNYRTNGNANQAAAIALYAILSIIPLFILTLLTVHNLFSGDPKIEKSLIEGIRQFVPSFSGALLTQFSHIAGKKDLLSWVGIITLIWLSAAIFRALEMALNIIFRSKIRRNFFASKFLAIGMIPLGWAIGIASVGITYVAAILAEQPLLARSGLPFMAEIEGILFRYLLPYLVTVLFFTIVYRVIPTTKIDWKGALAGSAIFSALMEIVKQFFTWYVTRYTRYNEIFGSLETVVILVIWVFYAAVILLFCAELISSYQRRDLILVEKTLLKSRKNDQAANERLFRKFGRLYRPDEYVFHEGEMSQGIFYILSGRVRMEKSAGQIRKILAEMGPGEYFGEIAALLLAPRTASVRCIETCHIAQISGEMFQDILRENGEVSLFMLREFSKRIRHANEALEATTRTSIRLAATLYFLRAWPLAEGRDPVADLAKATRRDADEIVDVLRELSGQGILTFADGQVLSFNRESALRLADEPTSV